MFFELAKCANMIKKRWPYLKGRLSERRRTLIFGNANRLYEGAKKRLKSVRDWKKINFEHIPDHYPVDDFKVLNLTRVALMTMFF